MSLMENVRKAVDIIIDFDLKDRRGLRQEYEQIDDDTDKEIRKEWTRLIKREIQADTDRIWEIIDNSIEDDCEYEDGKGSNIKKEIKQILGK